MSVWRALGKAGLGCIALVSCSSSDPPAGGPAGSTSTSASSGSGGVGGGGTTTATGAGGPTSTAGSTSTTGGTGGSTGGAGGSTGGAGGNTGGAGSLIDAGSDPVDASLVDASRPADGGVDGGMGVPGPEIDISPPELVFSAFLGMKSEERVLTLRNAGRDPLQIASFTFRTATFASVMPPATPLRVAPGTEATLRVIFSPPAQGMLGVQQGGLRITSDDPDEGMLEVGLWALATRAAQGANEPPLAQIVQALGYAINVGGNALELGTGANPIGDEVRAQLFRRAAAGPVTIRPVARYSPDEPVPFGFYTRVGAGPMLNEVGVMRMGNEQMLLPGVEPGSKSDFDPGDAPFGIYGTANAHTAYTEDSLNATGVRHAARSYPLKDRAGRPIANSYLVGFEEAANGDYNDYVFVLGNAMPAP